ncbi:MAG: hypothetical protein ACOC56_03855 [Atribacterota bacterium]
MAINCDFCIYYEVCKIKGKITARECDKFRHIPVRTYEEIEGRVVF